MPAVMPSTNLAYRSAIGLIWALALWHSWLCRGLFVDGSAFLLNIVRHEWFFDFYPPRLYAMIVAQLPIMTAVTLGQTDLHVLARLLSFGLFGLPTLLYTLALVRARREPVLLAVLIAAIGAIFFTTSFFIVGEYNSAYPLALLIAVRLVTAERLTIGARRPHLRGADLSRPAAGTHGAVAGVAHAAPADRGECAAFGGGRLFHRGDGGRRRFGRASLFRGASRRDLFRGPELLAEPAVRLRLRRGHDRRGLGAGAARASARHGTLPLGVDHRRPAGAL